MDQTFIRVKTVKDGVLHIIDKDIRDSTENERYNYCLSISKGAVFQLMEKVGGFKK